MKKVLIISPYFPPANAADMQRIRMSLPYFEDFGWAAEVVTCDPKYYDCNTDQLLLKSLPDNLKIHYVRAFDKKYTSKIGLGSLALRSLWFYKQKVNQILKMQQFDLIYFSTTQFPVCILGAYWKKRFKIPYVIDMQDPWHTDYYQYKPKHERPAKYWFSYRLNKYLEPIAMKQVDGIIAVSQNYISQLKERYPNLNHKSTAVVTFGYSTIDVEIAKKLSSETYTNHRKTLKYIGVLGTVMHKALNILFSNIGQIKEFSDSYEFIFKGTSYAPAHLAKKTTPPFSEKYDLTNVTESTERIGMYEVLQELQQADGLLIIGTDEPAYTASKLYPYLQTQKPLLAILHPSSSASAIIKDLSNAVVISLLDEDDIVVDKLHQFSNLIENDSYFVDYAKLEKFSAKALTQSQTLFFEKIIAQ